MLRETRHWSIVSAREQALLPPLNSGLSLQSRKRRQAMKQLATYAALGALLASPVALAQQSQQGQQSQNAQQMQRANMQSGQQQQGMQQNANRFVVGRLVDARTIQVNGPQGGAQHRLLKLESHSGEQIIVDMGQSRSPSAMGFKQGDLIVAMGKAARINGRPVLYAHYVGELRDLAGRNQTQGGTASR
jgi:hypothetical protein